MTVLLPFQCTFIHECNKESSDPRLSLGKHDQKKIFKKHVNKHMLTEQPFPEPSQDRQFKHKCLASPINSIRGSMKAGLKAIPDAAHAEPSTLRTTRTDWVL